MRVAMYYNNDDVRVEEIQKPSVGPGEILVKAITCGICGSDVLEWYRIKKAPRVLGHEMTGVIVEAGEDVKEFQIGDRVFVSHHVPCNNCRYCLNGHHTACETLQKTNFFPGGFSEYILVPQINVKLGTYLLPEDVTHEDGTFIEPLGCVIRGQRLAKIASGQTILVLGSGVAGLLHIKLAKERGVERVFATDINEYRLKAAKKFGADYVINGREDVPSILKENNEDRLADRVIVCTGALAAVKQALLSADKGCILLFFAVPSPDKDVIIPINEFWRNEITVMTSYGASPMDLEEALETISHNKINVRDMVTHKLGLKETGKGFQIVANAEECIKVIIEPYR